MITHVVILLMLGLVVIAVLVLSLWPWKGPTVRAVLTDDGFQEATVHVGEMAFSPRTVRVNLGAPVRLTFHRDLESPWCTGKVHVLAFGKVARIPAGEQADIEFIPDKAGTYEFFCSRQKLKGLVIVE